MYIDATWQERVMFPHVLMWFTSFVALQDLNGLVSGLVVLQSLRMSPMRGAVQKLCHFGWPSF